MFDISKILDYIKIVVNYETLHFLPPKKGPFIVVFERFHEHDERTSVIAEPNLPLVYISL